MGKKALGSPRCVGNLLGALTAVPDRRQARGLRHPLDAVLALIALGTMCGCQHMAAIAEWGRLLGPRLRKALGFTHPKTPAASTLHLVLSCVDVQALEQALRVWAGSLCEDDRAELRAIAIDGKTARGSAPGKEIPAIHVLSAFAVGPGVVLGSMEVGPKTNEAKRAESFVTEINVENAVITGDAAFAQKKLCAQVCAGHGDFLFAVKDNQPSLREAIETAFTAPDSPL